MSPVKSTINSEDTKRVHHLEARNYLQKSWGDRLADLLTRRFGTVTFLILNAIFFLVWIFINNGLINGLTVFDPFPYGLLTMIVSLEAIFLSTIVLISQNQASRVAETREKLDLLINIRAENEITKILNILDEIHDYIGLNPDDDAELTQMKKKLNVKKIEQQILDNKIDTIP